MAALFDDRFFLLGLAFYLSLIAGGPRWLHHLLGFDRPGRILRALVLTGGKRLNRAQRSASVRQWRGLVLVMLGASAAGVIGWALHGLAESQNLFYGLEILLLACLLPVRPVYEATRLMAKALKAGKLEDARTLANRFAMSETAGRDAYALCRAALEFLAGSFSRRLVAPAVWYLLLGLPGAMVVAWIERLSFLHDPQDSAQAAFARWPLLIDKTLQFLPNSLTGLLFLLATPVVPGTSLRRTLSVLAQEQGRVPVKIMAGALGVALEGPRRIAGTTIRAPWVGLGSAKVSLGDLARGQMLYAVASGLLVMAISLFNI